MKRHSLLFALVTLAVARPATAQTTATDSAFVGQCGAEITDGKWDLARTVDKFDGFTRDVSRQARWKTDDPLSPWIATSVQRFIEKSDTSYAIIASYFARDWMIIADGESLVFLADGERIGLSTMPNTTRREVQQNGEAGEQALYPVTLSVLKKLASAHDLEAKLTGTRRAFVLSPKMPEVACSLGRVVREVAK